MSKLKLMMLSATLVAGMGTTIARAEAGPANQSASAPVAHHSAADIDKREASFNVRIARGVAARELTPAEATDLRKRVAALKALETKYAAGGMTKTEERELEQRANQISLLIHKNKTDAQVVRH